MRTTLTLILCLLMGCGGTGGTIIFDEKDGGAYDAGADGAGGMGGDVG